MLKSKKEFTDKKLSDLFKNPSLLNLLHHSLLETINSRSPLNSNIFFSYQDTPIFSLVSEVMERFTGKYENLLKTVLEKSEYTILNTKKSVSYSFSSQMVNNSTINGDLNLVQNFFCDANSSIIEENESTQNIYSSKSNGNVIQTTMSEKSKQIISKTDAASDIKQTVTTKGGS